MRIRAKEVAKDLGLSEATVSLALNDRPGVRAETKQRVLDYIRKKEEETRIEDLNQKPTSDRGTVLMLNYIKSGDIMEHSDRDHRSTVAEPSPLDRKLAETVAREGYCFQHWVFREKVII